MSANKEAASSSSSEDARAEKSVDKLSVKEFRERFCIPNGVLVELIDGEAVSTEKAEDNVITFTKEQFNAGLRFPLLSLFKEFIHFPQTTPMLRPRVPSDPRSCQMDGRTISTNIDFWFSHSYKRHPNRVSGHTL